MMQPLAIVCIGGLTYGTLMTLFVIPIIYDLLNKKEIRVISDEDLAAIDE
jgi:HAE1 family hydrophobic/amphiphilic exporter-1